MVESREDGRDPERVELTSETIDSFLTDGNFSREDEMRQKETIGTLWEIQIESGDRDVLVTEDGYEFEL